MTDEVLWVRTVCERDGEVVVMRQEVRLSMHPSGAMYSFRCPSCGRRVVREASPSIVQVLVDGGVSIHQIELPPRPQVDGPPIDHDAVIDFWVEMEAADDPLSELT